MDHLRLSTWPFSVVPRPEHCGFLAGRAQLREDVTSLLRSLTRRDTSSIHILWSWFGAGKTHSLYYLKTQAEALNANSGNYFLCPVYSEFPRGAKGFLELYRAFINAIDPQLLRDSFLEASTSPAGSAFYEKLLLDAPDLASALRNLAMGSTGERSLALQWLRAEPVVATEFRRIGISQRLISADQAIQTILRIRAICEIGVRTRGHPGLRLILLLDEFQRLGRTSAMVVREVNGGLHSLFNACPTGLSMVISFSGKPDPKKLPDWLGQELRDRIGATRVLVLPPFQEKDALQFIREVLANFRKPGLAAPHEYFPFTKQACERTIAFLAKKKTELRPRTLIHAFNAVLEFADPLIEKGQIAQIEADLAGKVLAEFSVLSDSEED